MANHELVGNLDTSKLLEFLDENNFETKIDHNAYLEAKDLALDTFLL